VYSIFRDLCSIVCQMRYKQTTSHISDQKVSTWHFISMLVLCAFIITELNSMTAVPYQCFVLSIVNNFVIILIRVLVPHSVLTNLWFTLSPNNLN